MQRDFKAMLSGYSIENAEVKYPTVAARATAWKHLSSEEISIQCLLGVKCG